MSYSEVTVYPDGAVEIRQVPKRGLTDREWAATVREVVNEMFPCEPCKPATRWSRRDDRLRGLYEGCPAVLARPCPRCDAVPGQPCVSGTGIVTYPHVSRRDAAASA